MRRPAQSPAAVPPASIQAVSTRGARFLSTSTLLASTAIVLGASVLVGGCGEKVKYKPEPAYSGPKPSLPKVPQVPATTTWKNGTNWTVYGLQHQLMNPKHRKEVDGVPAVIEGYVVKVYRPTEPAGKEGCIYPQKKAAPTSKDPTPKGVQCDTVKYEPPHFFIADNKDEKNPAKMITVMGYASSYIQQYMAVDQYKKKNVLEKGDRVKTLEKITALKDDDKYLDNNYSATITILGEPKIGARVVVSGQFAARYQEGQGGTRVVPYGIIDVTSHKKGKIDYKEGEEEMIDLR